MATSIDYLSLQEKRRLELLALRFHQGFINDLELTDEVPDTPDHWAYFHFALDRLKTRQSDCLDV